MLHPQSELPARFDHVKLTRGLLFWLIDYCWLLCTAAVAQSVILKPTAPQYRVWREAQGLPIDRIKDIHQTRDGYLWLATSHGLVRFDGVRFLLFNLSNTPVLRSNDCWKLAEDEEGALWIGTSTIVKYMDGRFHEIDTSGKMADSFVGTFTIGRKTGLWVGTREGLSRLQHGRWTTYRIAPGELAGRVLRIHEDQFGKVWVGTVNGLQVLDPETTKFSTNSPRHPYETQNVLGIETDSAGRAWVLYLDNKFQKYHLMQMENGAATELPMSSLDLDGYGLIATPQSPAGFARIPTRWLSVQKYDTNALQQLILPVQPHDVVSGVVEDLEGGLWMGTWNSGLYRFSAEQAVDWLRQGLPDSPTWAVTEDSQGALWAGTDSGMVRFQHGKTETFSKRNGLSDDYVRAFAFDSAGRLWIGTTDGLNVFENGRLRTVPVTGKGLERKIRSILWARDGSLWLGTDGGIFQQSSGIWTKYTTDDELSDNRAPLLAEDSNGTVWIGTQSCGLQRWVSGQLTRFTTKDGLPTDRVSSLSLDSKGVLWVGSGVALCRWDGERLVTVVSAARSPFDSPIRGIVEDDANYYWIFCANGIFGARREDLLRPEHGSIEQAITRINLGNQWNLQSESPKSQPVCWKTRDGRILFSTSNGILSLDPRQLQRTSPPPRVLIEQIIANGETVYANSSIGFNGQSLPISAGIRPQLDLPPGSGGNLEIYFTETTFTDSEQIHFKYKLEGVDRDWMRSGKRRSAFYSHLPPGEFVFHVMVCDQYRDWPESSATVPIYIAARLFESTWFRALISFALAGTIAGIGRWRLSVSRRLQFLEQNLAITNERARLARDLHDQLGSEVTRALRLSEQLEPPSPRTADLTPQKLRISLAAMRQRLDAAVWAIAPDKDNIESFIDFTVDRVRSLLDSTDIELDLTFPDYGLERSLPPQHRHELAMILLEGVTNALRHAHARCIRLVFAIQPESFNVEIQDNGIGFEVESSSRARQNAKPELPCPPRNGIDGMRARANLIGARLTFDSRPGCGTSILVSIPLVNEKSK